MIEEDGDEIEELETYLHNLEKQADHNSGVLFRVADMADQVHIATAENTAVVPLHMSC